MLNPKAPMVDIDVGHWRNLQALLLDPASARPRIVVIHEDGEILKFAHSEGAGVIRNVERVEDARTAAEEIYRANSEAVEFVAVFERRAMDRFFAEVQDSWSSDDDVDEFVHRMYSALDKYPDGIATYPDSPGMTLGLQWRVGANYEEVEGAISRYIAPNSTAVFGIFEDDALWASLVLGFDSDGKVSLITTADPSEVDFGGDPRSTARELVEWANGKFSPCSLGLFVDLGDAKTFLASRDKAATLRDLASKDKLIADPAPKPLSQKLANS